MSIHILASVFDSLKYSAFYGVAGGFTEFAQLLPHTRFMHAINSLMAISDAAIALVLSFLLHQSRSGFRHTETMINRLIIFTINTGVLTGICAVMTLICNIAFPDTFIYMIFYILVARGMFDYPFNGFYLTIVLQFTRIRCSLRMSIRSPLSIFNNYSYMLLLSRLNSRDNIRHGTPDTTKNGANSVHLERLRMYPQDGLNSVRSYISSMSAERLSIESRKLLRVSRTHLP